MTERRKERERGAHNHSRGAAPARAAIPTRSMGKGSSKLLRDELDASSAQIVELQVSLQRAYTIAEDTVKDRDRAVTAAWQEVETVRVQAGAELEAAHALTAVASDEVKVAQDRCRAEIAAIRERLEVECRTEVAAARAEAVAARRATNVATDLQEAAEVRAREVKRWVQKEHSKFGHHIQRLNDQVADTYRDNVCLRQLLDVHDKRLKEEERKKTETMDEKDRILADSLRRQEIVDALTGQSTNLVDENARIMSLLKAEMAKVDDLTVQLRDTRLALAEAENVASDKYHNMFLENEWSKFNEANQAFTKRLEHVERQKDDAIKELEAFRGRLRESKHLPHLGVQWVMWGKANKAAAVHPSQTPPSEVVKPSKSVTSHRRPPSLPSDTKPLEAQSNHTHSAPSLALRPRVGPRVSM